MNINPWSAARREWRDPRAGRAVGQQALAPAEGGCQVPGRAETTDPQ